jgi:UDP-glucose 6-dehydrogenase
VIVCVQGLWHLGSVTAACLAAAGHSVIGLDFDRATVAKLAAGAAPIAEPGLDALLHQHAGRLAFTSDATAAAEADVLWSRTTRRSTPRTAPTSSSSSRRSRTCCRTYAPTTS